MKTRNRHAAAAGTAAILLAATVAPAGPPPKTKVGDKAPPLSVEKWVKGELVTKFEKGKVYLVEFWGTWCGPCIASIPKLSKLQETHAKDGLVVIGVASHEFDGFKALERFMKKRGHDMKYAVAFDEDLSMQTDWQGKDLGDQFNMPEAFIIGRDGKVAWVGHPLEETGGKNELELALQKALAAQAE